MNDELKIYVYQRLINKTDFDEKKAVKKTACVLYAKKFANGMKEIYFYSSDFMGDGEDLFQMDYNITYTNGEFQNGNCMVDTKDIITAFGYTNYDELKAYLAGKYSDDEKAWQKIVKEIKEKGLNPNIDENEGGPNFMSNNL